MPLNAALGNLEQKNFFAVQPWWETISKDQFEFFFHLGKLENHL